MVHLTPCFGCGHKSDCAKLEEIKKALKGTGVTSAKIRCLIPKGDLPPGTRVQVHGDRALVMCCQESDTGTIVKYDPSRRKFAVMLDDAPWGNETMDGDEGVELCRYQRFYHKELRAIPEPLRATCKCGWAMVDGKCDLPQIRGAVPECHAASFDQGWEALNLPATEKGLV